MTKQVAILGCGPAGLMVGHACRMMGHQATVYSNKHKSPMLGAQYLHQIIPGIPHSRSLKLSYILEGTIEDYRDKIYGDAEADITVSPEQFVGIHESWSLREAYNWLWTKWQSYVVSANITQEVLQELAGSNDVVVSTIPAKALCYDERHMWWSTKVLVDSFWHGGQNYFSPDIRNVVVCNGRPYEPKRPSTTGWYRTSAIFGQQNTEWSPKVEYRPSKTHWVEKPIATDCDCWPSIVRAGRYGQWRKGVLTHDAFELALEVLA
jgi:hypothetical protein